MELDIPRDQECSQKDAEMVEPCLSVANADIWHGWSSRTNIVAGMVPGYDPAFPQLGLQPPAGGGGTSIPALPGRQGQRPWQLRESG